MSIEAYKSARKRALKDKNTQLPALEDLQPAITRKETLPAGYIPLDKVAGTVTRGRMSAFNKDFLPLLDDHSEFAAKWSHLYDAQLSEGIHDPVSAYEYMGRYYILEGNKRVSVLKYLGAPEILAKITRLIPANDDSPEMNHYFANQQNQQKTGVTWLEFVHPHTDWSRLEIVLDTDKHPWNDKLREDLKSAWTRFKVIFDKKGGDRLRIPAPQAFLRFLELYGLDEFSNIGETELTNQVSNDWDDFIRWPDNQPGNLETEEPQGRKPLLDFIKEDVKAAFIHSKTPETSAWTRHHEQGRLWAQSQLPEAETRSWFDCSTPEKTTAALEEARKEGCNVLFTTDPNMLKASIRFGAKYPDIKILNCSLNNRTGHIRTYYSRNYESQFLTGIIAGILSSNGKIGYVADYPIYGSIAAINAFALGAAMTQPDAKVYLDWSTTTQATSAIPEDCELMYIAGQDFDPDLQTNKEYGLFDIGSQKFLKLTHDAEYWGTFYLKMLRRIRDRRWSEDRTTSINSVNYWWGISNGMTDIELSDSLPDAARQLVRLVREAMRKGYNPLETTMKDQTHTSHFNSSARDLMEMDWLAENITGTIPPLSEFTDSAREVIRNHGLALVKES